MDEFKKYLFEHRDELDTEKPPRPQVWKHIRQQTQEVKKPAIPLIAKWATAAAAILVAASVLIYQFQRPVKTDDPILSVNTDPKTNTTPEPNGQADSSTGTASMQENKEPDTELPGDKTLAENNTPPDNRKTKKDKIAGTQKPASPTKTIEDDYVTIINYQLKKLETTPIYTESAGYFHVFKKQWLDLEKDERKVKQDVRLYGLNDQIVGKLIQLYQQKLWLLGELQAEISKMNVRAQQHPDIKRSKPAYLKL
jgi:hypothetical protein